MFLYIEKKFNNIQGNLRRKSSLLNIKEFWVIIFIYITGNSIELFPV